MQNSPAIQRVLAKIADYLSPQIISKLLVGLIIFISATQLGLHFWPDSSLVYGVRVDYLAPTLYFLDILIILFLGFDLLQRTLLKRNSRLQVEKGPAVAGRKVLMGTLIPILLVNLLYSHNPLATLSWSLHLILYLLFFAALGSDFSPRTVLYGIMRSALALALLFQLILAITQVSLGHSLGGLMYYMGERSISVGSPAIALGTFMGEVVLRAYGTFGHPNVLAGWSVIVLLILTKVSQTATAIASKQLTIRGSDPLRKSWLVAKMFSRLQNTIRRPGQTLWVLITIFIVILTQSRTAALSLFGIIIPFYLIKNYKLRLLYLTIFLCSLFYILLQFPLRPDSSVTERATLQRVSFEVIQTFPIFGTGAQASISSYPSVTPETRLFQPDHNSFTLFISWFGLFGILAIIYLLKSELKFRNSDFKFIFPLLPLLLFDHYLLTSPQGLFTLLIYMQLARGRIS